MSANMKAAGLTGHVLSATSALVGNSSLGIKLVCLTVLLSYGLSYVETSVDVISVTPGYFWPPHFYLWTAFTHCYLEIHWWEVVVDVFTLILVGKLLEPLWGALEMVTFFVVVNVGVGVFCAIFYYFLYMITFNEALLFEVHIHGLAGYLAGVSVAVKQAMPDHILYKSPMGKFTNRNIPFSVFGLSFVMWAVGLVEGSYCTMFGSGLIISWVYLRFYQMHANGSRGDTADSFSFASFFPNVIQPPVAVLGNSLFAILIRLRICKRPIRRYDVGGSSLGGAGGAGPSISISLPGQENHDTERRRQIALKALSDRLSKAESGPEKTAWPSLNDSKETAPLLQEQPSEVHKSGTQGPSDPMKATDSDIPEDAVLVDVEGGTEEPRYA